MADFTGKRLLLVEDMEVNREIVRALLEPTGLLIDEAEHGRAAVEAFTASPGAYNIVFMDIQMPKMDGYEATRAIRALDTPEALAIPIIAMTASVFKEDIEKSLEAGMNGHIAKPIDLEDVMQNLKTWLL
jgi:CheY-like chemotaxis protein